MFKHILILVVVFSLALGACAPATPKPTATVVVVAGEKTNKELQNGKPFRMAGGNRQHPFYRLLWLGITDACRDLDVLCEDSGYVGTEISPMAGSVDTMIATGTSGMLTGVDKQVYAPIQKMVDAGIPVMSIHTITPEGDVPGLIGWVAPNPVAYSQECANVLGAKINGKGTVAITQNTLNDIENAAASAFTAEMKAKYPDVVVLSPELETSDPIVAIGVATAILQKHPDLAAAFGTTAYSPVTWGKALQAVGQKPGQTIVIGMDPLQENLDMVRDGWIYAIIAQPVYEEAYRAIELLVAHLRGEPVAYQNYYPSPIVYKDGIQKYYDRAKQVTSGE